MSPQLILVVAALFVAGVDAAETEIKTDAKWTYKTQSNDGLSPDKWAEGYPTCGGPRQSPIMFDAVNVQECPEGQQDFIFTNGKCTVADMQAEPRPGDWGDVLLPNCKELPSVQIGDKIYDFLQMHVHSAAEHSFSGGISDLELHLVHSNRDKAAGDLLVFGVQLQVQAVNQDNFLLTPALDKISAANGGAASYAYDTESFSPYSLLPADGRYYTYPGSLTTPPCSEIVTWFMMETPVYLSKAQLDTYRNGVRAAVGSKVDAKGNNNRPLQPINDRKISYCTL